MLKHADVNWVNVKWASPIDIKLLCDLGYDIERMLNRINWEYDRPDNDDITLR